MVFLIPGYTETETITTFFDNLCEYARYFGDEKYHQLVHWSTACIEKYGAETLLETLSEDVTDDFEREKIELVARIHVNTRFVKGYNQSFLSELELSPAHPKYEVFPNILKDYNDEYAVLVSQFNLKKRILMKLAWDGAKIISDLAFKLLSPDDREEVEDWHAFRVVSMVYCVRN